jgi:hypothetical protein
MAKKINPKEYDRTSSGSDENNKEKSSVWLNLGREWNFGIDGSCSLFCPEQVGIGRKGRVS